MTKQEMSNAKNKHGRVLIPTHLVVEWAKNDSSMEEKQSIIQLKVTSAELNIAWTSTLFYLQAYLSLCSNLKKMGRKDLSLCSALLRFFLETLFNICKISQSRTGTTENSSV